MWKATMFNGIILTDRDLDDPYSSAGNEEVVFVNEMKVRFYSSGLLERALSICKEKDISLHILVTRWFSSAESFEAYCQEADNFWWYHKLCDHDVRIKIHLSQKLHRFPAEFLDRVSRNSLGLDLPTREYLGEKKCLSRDDIRTLLFKEGWLTVAQKNIWEVLLSE